MGAARKSFFSKNRISPLFWEQPCRVAVREKEIHFPFWFSETICLTQRLRLQYSQKGPYIGKACIWSFSMKNELLLWSPFVTQTSILYCYNVSIQCSFIHVSRQINETKSDKCYGCFSSKLFCVCLDIASDGESHHLSWSRNTLQQPFLYLTSIHYF